MTLYFDVNITYISEAQVLKSSFPCSRFAAELEDDNLKAAINGLSVQMMTGLTLQGSLAEATGEAFTCF